MAQAPAPAPQPGPRRSWLQQRLSAASVASVVALVVLLIFIFQNTKDVTIHFLVASFTWPLWLYTIVVALVGAMVWFGLGVRRRRQRRKARRAGREAERQP